MKNTTRYRALLLILLMLVGTFAFPLSFTAEAYSAPTVTTNDATGVEETNATLHGTLTDAFNSIIYNAQGTYRKGYQGSSDVQCTPGSTSLSAGEYALLQTVDGNYVEQGSNSKKYSNIWFNFTINETVSDISSVSIYTKAEAEDMDSSFNWNNSGTLWVKNQDTGLWENKSYLTRIPWALGTTWRWMNATLSSNLDDYIQGGKLMFLIENSHEGDWEYVDLDYVMVNVTYNGSATVRFQYGFTTGYGTNSTNQDKDTGDSFLFDATGLTQGKLYHYRTHAYTTFGNGYGSDKTFLTKPNEPTGITITNTGSGEQTISWTHGTGYNRSVVRGTIGSYPATPQSGTAVYNGSSNSVVRGGLSLGDDWYYRVWEYSSWGSLHQFSDLYSNGHKTVIVTPAVTMNTATGVTQTNATLRGTLTSDGGEATCTVRFTYRCIPDFLLGPPPYPSWYVNWTNTTNQTKTIGQTFSANISANIPYPGVLVECKVFANNSITSYLSSSYYFMTPSNVATNFAATDLPTNHSQRLTWTKGTMARRTVIRVGTSGFPANPQSGTAVYNGTGSSCYYTGATLPGQLYYYRAWEYAVQEWGAPTGYFAFSNYTRIGCLTKPASITNVSISSVSTTRVNFTWDKGLGANRTVIVRKTGSYPTSRTDGTIVYNGTASYFNYTSIPADTYLSAWSWTNWTYNPTLSQFSLDPTIMPWKVIGVNVFNESKPSQALTFSIQIRNANGSEVLQYLNNTGFLFVDLTNFTSGSNVYMRAWATNYQARERTFPIFQNNYYNISFYLPRKVVDDGGDPEGGGNENTSELRGYIDSISVTSNLTDATIPLTHALDSMISVEIYKSGCTVRAHTDSKTITSYTANVWMTLSYSSVGISSVQVWNTTLYGTYGGLVFIPADKYTYYSANHTVKIDKSVLNSHALTITIAKVDYSYNDCSGGEFGIWVSVPSNKYTYTSTSVIVNKTGYDNTTTMIRVNYYYLYYTGAITITVYYVRVVENINTEYSNYDLPVADATVIFKRYMNTTGAYEIISNLITDANGYVNIYLIPNVQYLIHVDKTGYDSTDSNYIPVPGNQLGQTIEKVLRIVKTAVTPGSINYEFMMKNITWDYSPKGLTIHGAFTFYFNITSSDSQLEWYSMQVLQFNYSSHLWENISYQIAFNAGGGTLSYNVPNVTGRYAFHCWFKKINYSAYELSQTGSFDKFLVYFEQWMADIPDYAYYIVLIVIMMIVSGFCFMYLGTGILTGYIALGIMAIGLFITDDVSIAIGSNTNISGWVIFAITFILYTVGLFLWSKL